MFKIVAVVFAAILAVAFAAPNPSPKPGVLAYGSPLAYSSPLAYTAPLAYSSQYAYSAPAYSAPAVVSAYGAAPLAYSAYSAPAVYY